jgi:hypothetical protein
MWHPIGLFAAFGGDPMPTPMAKTDQSPSRPEGHPDPSKMFELDWPELLPAKQALGHGWR